MAMGLASMNPMVGAGLNTGNIMVNSLCPEKDAQWGEYSVTKTLDNDDNRLTVDNNGKLCVKDKKELEETYIHAYYINNEFSDAIMESLLYEAYLPYDERPVHPKSYLYEVFTGNKLYTYDQAKYDPLLEEIELEKFSKAINDDAINLDNQFKSLKNNNKVNYRPDDNYPLMNRELREHAIEILKNYPSNISIYEDMNGFYGFNEISKLRTLSYKSLDEISFTTIMEDYNHEDD